MSVDCISWAFKMEIPPTERFVLVAICDRADKRQGRFIAWPSYRDISERTGYHASTVKRAVSQLMEWGLIESEKRTAATGRPRSNLYTLHIEREAPQEVASSSRAALQPGSASAESVEETDTSTTPHGEVSRSATIKSASERSRTATMDGRAPRPPCMNRQLETISAPKTENAEAVTDRFDRTCGAYQRHNVLFALGDRQDAWKRFRKLSVVAQVELVGSIDNLMLACKAQFARWRDAPKTSRGTKPAVPSLKSVIAHELWKSIGTPSEPGPAATLRSENIDLCRKIATNSTFGTIWIAAGSPGWNAWLAFFKKHGQGMPMRRATFADCYDAKAEKGSDGWRFPSSMPPAIETTDPPAQPRTESEDFAELHYGSGR